MTDIEELAARVTAWSTQFHPSRMQKIPFAAAHLHEEASEAFKAWRDSDISLRYEEHTEFGRVMHKPEGAAAEIADVILTALRLGALMGLSPGDMAYACEQKMGYQEKRLINRTQARIDHRG